MIPGSPFLARLHDGAWPSQVRLTSIWSREDAVSPYPTAVIDTHGLPQLANVEVQGDHRAFLVRKRIYEAILHELRTAEAEAPSAHGPLTGLAGGRAQRARALGGEPGREAPESADASGSSTARLRPLSGGRGSV
jgi:hypothetical protein